MKGAGKLIVYMRHVPEFLPVPAPLTPRSSVVADQAQAYEQLLLDPSTPWLSAVATVSLSLLGGLPAIPAILYGGIAMFGQNVVSWTLFHRYFSLRCFRRALYYAEQLEQSAWLDRFRTVCRINRIACHIGLGEFARAKALLRTVSRDRLAPVARAALEVNMAALYVRMMAPDSALALLDEVAVRNLPPDWVAYFHFHRASAHVLREDWKRASDELGKVDEINPPPEIRISAMGLRAVLLADEAKDRAAALALSNEAVRRVGGAHRAHLLVLVTHARLILETTGSAQDCLDMLSAVIGHENELWLSGQAEFHYLLARCYFLCGVEAEVRPHLDAAAAIPSPPRLRFRIRALEAEVALATAGLASGAS